MLYLLKQRKKAMRHQRSNLQNLGAKRKYTGERGHPLKEQFKGHLADVNQATHDRRLG